MHSYIVETRHAVTEVIRLITAEENELKQRQEAFSSLINESEFFYREFASKDLSEDFDELHVIADFNRHARARQDAEQLKPTLDELEQSIEAKKFSVIVVCGSLLQIARQGISIVHGDLKNCHAGRMLEGESLKNVIWHARNQALHFEKKITNEFTIACFQKLEADFGPQFSLDENQGQSLARDVIRLLEWNSYAAYENDMVSLLG